MRRDWEQRAREDAVFYAAFARPHQTEAEFAGSAADVVRLFESDLIRLPSNTGHRRALEIGCGPARLLLPLSRHFAEIHGVDISEEMIAKARERAGGTPHIYVSVNNGTDLSAFASAYFDYVYSFVVS